MMLKSLQLAGRSYLAASAALALAMMLSGTAFAAPPSPNKPPQYNGNGHVQAPQPPRNNSVQRNFPRPQQPAQSRPHLGEWIQNHQNLSPQDQTRALQREPGFRSLPPQQQLRLANRLHDLNSLPPNVRQRVLNRTEALERLSPGQRQQVRGAMQNFAVLPPDRKRVVGQAFRELRNMPPDQRYGALQSGRYGQLNDQDRSVLNGLFNVEPILPSSHDEQVYRSPQP